MLPWTVQTYADEEYGTTQAWVKYPNGEDSTIMSEEDATFIATARTALPELIRRIKALQKELPNEVLRERVCELLFGDLP